MYKSLKTNRMWSAAGPAFMLAAAAPALGLVPQHEANVVAVASAGQQNDDEPVLASYVFVEQIESDDEAENKQVRVEVVDGKPRVWVNGEEVPADQLQNEDGRVIVMDENGDMLQSVRIFADEAPGRMRLRRSAEPGSGVWLAAAAAVDTEAPPVMLGVYMEDPGEALRRHLNLKEGATTLIGGVYEGLPAHNAGLEEYDIILSVNGSDDAGPSQIRQLLKDRAAGDTLDLEVLHNGKRKSLTVRLEKYDHEKMGRAAVHGDPVRKPFGELMIPGRGEDELFVPMPPMRVRGDFDPEKIDEIVREAIERAMRGTEQIRREAPAMLHEHLDVGRDQLDRRLEQLHRHIERMEKLIHEYQRQLHEDHEGGHDELHEDHDRDGA